MEKYKILTCAGFGNTGSSVVTDYLAEFDSIDVRAGAEEFRFLHDYGGVSMLEDCLVKNYHKQNSDGAIQAFLQMVRYQSGTFFARKYEKYFGGEFEKKSIQFIDELTDAKWNGHLETAIFSISPIWRLLYYQIYPRLIKLMHGWKGYIGKYYPTTDVYYSSPTEDYFIECTKRYLAQLFSVLDPHHEKEYLYLDQLLPPTNIERYFKYFDDIKVIVVDRDPRDVYIETIYYFGDTMYPHSVDQFIKLYRKQRQFIEEEKEDSRILRIKFEDTIFHYDDFCERIKAFVGLDESSHVNPKSKFNPEKSINNTQLWKKYSIPHVYLEIIENELSDYCYDYNQ